MFRFLLTGAWTVVFLILSIPLIIIEWIIGWFNPRARAESSQVIIAWAFKSLLYLVGARITVIGEDKVPLDRPVLYVPNHRSIFDIIMTYVRVPRQTGYVAKKETKRVPIFSIWMAFMNCQFLDRSDLRDGLRVINKSAELIKQGSSMCIFPEGTRNKGTEPMLPFHEGSFKIAQRSGCPIVPVIINNSDDIFEAHLPKVRKTHVIIEYLDPIEVDGLSNREFKETVSGLRERMIEAYLNNQTNI